MEANVKLYALNFKEVRTYLYATLFIVGNIAFPQLCHIAMPHGGMIFLPIYFFTLIGAYKYGIKVGLITAVLSPVINSLLFGMPAMAMLPTILVKSILLALAAGYMAKRSNNVSVLALIGVVLTYQIIGSVFEMIWAGSMMAGMQDFRMGLPGMLLQIFGGYLFIKYLIRK